MAEEIDARGLSCPQPVVMTKKALEEVESGTIDVLVDTKAASENVARFARSAGCNVTTEERNGTYTIHVTKGKQCTGTPGKTEKETAVFIKSNTLGRGNDELGTILMRSFIPTLLEIEHKPKKIVFMNSGVKLTVDGSPVLEFFQNIEKEGVELLVCGTCLDYFGLKDTIRAGRVSNMFEIVETLTNADRVMSI